MRVLLVESDSVLAENVARYMTKQGLKPSIVASAQDAILACDAQLPDAIVLDIALSGHSGIEFLHEFRSYHEWSHVPIILWSMQYMTQSQLKSLYQLGVNSVLYKPKTTLQQICQQLQLASANHA